MLVKLEKMGGFEKKLSGTLRFVLIFFSLSPFFIPRFNPLGKIQKRIDLSPAEAKVRETRGDDFLAADTVRSISL